MTDPLTGLVNRRALFEAFSGKVLEPGMAVVMFDLDHFKAINDQLGHAVGDVVLQHFAQIVQRQYPRHRYRRAPGRRGILHGLATPVLAPGSRRRRAHPRLLRQATATKAGPTTVTATVSAGIAISAAEGEMFEDLLNRADDALYQAKNAGRNRVHPPGLRARCA